MAEHLQESDDKLKVLLFMCLNEMLVHSYLHRYVTSIHIDANYKEQTSKVFK